MRFHNAPKRDLQDKSWLEVTAEILPDWKKAAQVALAIIGICAAIIGSQDLLQVQKAIAAESLYRHLDREWPKEGRLAYVPFNDICLRLARFDHEQGRFYGPSGYFGDGAEKWLYVTDTRPEEIRFCTKKDLVVSHD